LAEFGKKRRDPRSFEDALKDKRTAAIFSTIGATFRRFNADRCFRDSIIISYFALLCAVPLLALFAFLSSKFMGDAEIAVRSLNIFSEEFFARFDPSFFRKLGAIAGTARNLGWIGIAGSIISASFLFGNIIGALNNVFKGRPAKSFFYNRLMEYVAMAGAAVMLLLSFSITAVWTTAHRAIKASDFAREALNPEALALINSFFVQYLIPFTLGFLVLFLMFKFVPEAKVATRAAVLAAVIGSLLWEVFKRIFVVYVANFSAVGVVMSKVVAGTLTSIIFFLLWISFSLAIMLWCAELAALLNERMKEKAAEK
jgi:membrane protein